MTRHHQRGAKRERQLALLFGTQRVLRRRGESAPDVEPVPLPDGRTLTLESKERAAPMKVAERWLTQAESYTAPGEPAAVVVFTTGRSASDALVILRLPVLRALAGKGAE